MHDPKLHIHHVGGRDGEVGGFPLNPEFRNDVVVHIYEADADCTKQIAELNSKRGHLHRIYPWLISDKPGPARLNVTYEPCLSSIRPPAPSDHDFYIATQLIGDHIWNDAIEIVKPLEMDATTIDLSAQRNNIPVDVLSIDTQGTEDMVLRGASEQLQSNTIAVVAEVSFRELYVGQPLFGDISKQMTDAGFDFLRFLNGRRRDTSQFRNPIGWRDRAGGQMDDALFFRALSQGPNRRAVTPRALTRLGFIALSFGHLELTIECCRRVFAQDVVPKPDRFTSYLRDLYALYLADEHLWMPTFRELYSLSESFARFDEDILHHWNIYSTDDARKRYFKNCDRQQFEKRLRTQLSEDMTPVESFLKQSGFADVASNLGKRRRSDAEVVARMLHLVHHGEPVTEISFAEISGPRMRKHVCKVRRRRKQGQSS